MPEHQYHNRFQGKSRDYLQGFSEGLLEMHSRLLVAKSPEQAKMMPIEFSRISIRCGNCLRRQSVNTYGQLCSMTRKDLLRIRNMGIRSVEEVEALMLDRGLYLKESHG